MTDFTDAELRTLGYVYDQLMIGRSVDIAMAHMRGLSGVDPRKIYGVEVLGIPYRGWYDEDHHWRRIISCRDYAEPGWWQVTCTNHGGSLTRLMVSLFLGDEAVMRADLCATRLALR